jgi:hypothetical protein
VFTHLYVQYYMYANNNFQLHLGGSYRIGVRHGPICRACLRDKSRTTWQIFTKLHQWTDMGTYVIVILEYTLYYEQLEQTLRGSNFGGRCFLASVDSVHS